MYIKKVSSRASFFYFFLIIHTLKYLSRWFKGHCFLQHAVLFYRFASLFIAEITLSAMKRFIHKSHTPMTNVLTLSDHSPLVQLDKIVLSLSLADDKPALFFYGIQVSDDLKLLSAVFVSVLLYVHRNHHAY